MRRRFDVRRIELVLALAGFGLMERPRRAERKLRKRVIHLERRVETNFDLNLFFKLQSLKTVRTFFKILFSRFFPQKVMASFILTGQELS